MITGAPCDMPDTVPVAAPIVASVVLLLLQVPPAVASLSVAVSPAQIAAMPLIAAGSGFIVTTVVEIQPPTTV